MLRSKRMTAVVNVASRKEDEAAEAFSKEQQMLDQHKAQMRSLEEYRLEYRQNMVAQGGKGMTIADMQEYRLFLVKLDQAIEQQMQLVGQAKHRVEMKKRDWLKARMHTKALDKVVERYRDEERRLEDKREQSASDELAQRKGFKNI